MQQRIKLHIVSTDLQMTVEREDEHLYRAAQRKINDTYNQLRSKYPTMTADEIWTHTALRLALNYTQLLEHADLNPVLEQITNINQQITDVLTQNETQHVSN